MKISILALCWICIIPSCSDKTQIDAVENQTELASLTLSTGENTLVIKKLKAARIWATPKKEVVKFELEMDQADHSRVKGFTSEELKQLIDLKINGTLVSKALLHSVLSANIGLSGAEIDSDQLKKLLQSLLIVEEVTLKPASELPQNNRGIIETMESIFNE